MINKSYVLPSKQSHGNPMMHEPQSRMTNIHIPRLKLANYILRKKSTSPPNYEGGLLYPPLRNSLIYPLNFAKPAKSPPRAVLDSGLLQYKVFVLWIIQINYRKK
jgi:hypothetical protein